MNRKDELMNIVCKDNSNKLIIQQLVDEIIFIEDQLRDLRKDNFIRRNPNNPQMVKRDKDAIKQYKEFLQQYTNCIKVLTSMTNDVETEDESPLRKWVKSRKEG